MTAISICDSIPEEKVEKIAAEIIEEVDGVGSEYETGVERIQIERYNSSEGVEVLLESEV